MADDVTIPASGTGSATPVIATDDVGGRHFQRIKIDVGAEGVSALLGAANPVPVSDAGGSLTVDAPVGTPVSVRLSDGAASYDGAKTGQLPAALESDRLKVDGSNVTGIANGRTVVTTAGTRVVLAASTACKKVDVQAELDNTGVVVVGGTGVVAALATRQGIALNAGDSYSLEIDNLNDVNLDSTVSGDGVTYAYYT